jgi:hypothetical protein
MTMQSLLCCGLIGTVALGASEGAAYDQWRLILSAGSPLLV